MVKVLIVGSAGTTGIRLQSRLKQRDDVELIEIPDEYRKDPNEIKKAIELSEYVFLCLPDEAAIETVIMAKDTKARIIDTSTAHRTADSWAYGFPELSLNHRERIRSSKYVASPGCHASGFISLIYPLISEGILSKECPLTCTSLTGYSGGGKKMISDYENSNRQVEFDSSYLYAMGQEHKHLPEIIKHCGLSLTPVFMPIVGDFYSGMLVTIPLHISMLNGNHSVSDIIAIYKKHYAGSSIVNIIDPPPSSLYTNALSGRDDMEIFVSGNEDRILLSSRFDNLGKGASGAAIQCFNIMCGFPEDTSLICG